MSRFKDDYDSHGWVAANGILDRSLVERVRDRALVELDEWDCTLGVDSTSGRPTFNDGVDPRHGVMGARLEETSIAEVAEELAHSEALRMHAASLIGCPESDLFVHPNKVIRALPPDSATFIQPAGVHVDFMELQGSLKQLTCWIPLAKATANTGTLPVYSSPEKAPHEIPMMRLTSTNRSGWEVVVPDGAKEHEESLEPGDVLAFNTLTPHGGSTNQSNTWRLSLEVRFQPIYEPIAEPSMKPFRARTWSDHYADWRSDLRHYWADRHPDVVPFDTSWERWRDVCAVTHTNVPLGDRYRALEIAAEFATSPSLRSFAREQLSSIPDEI